MEVAIIKAFTFENKGGNGAGVVILDEQIPDVRKQEISKKVGLSETAFVYKSGENDFEVSFFTPLCQVDLCGHATIAAFYYLGKRGYIKGNDGAITLFQNTKAGRLKIEVTFKDGDVDFVLMQQARPRIYGELDKQAKQIARSLNLDENLLGLKDYDIRPTIVSTGLKDIMVAVKSREVLNNLLPDYEMIERISYENDVVGYHVFTLEEGSIYARNFAPKVGIDEECATGTSNGALGSLLYSKALVGKQIKIIQGEAMNEKSLIYVKVEDHADNLDVYVGGQAFVESIMEV